MLVRRLLAPNIRPQQASAGFTLFESVLVILILGILSAYAAPKAFNTSKMTLSAQAKTLASNLQRVQLLASTTGQPLYFCSFNSGYLAQTAASCPAAMPAQASANQPVFAVLDNGATLSGSPNPLAFNTMGEPLTAGSFQLQSAPTGSGTITVTAAAVTGLISISP